MYVSTSGRTRCLRSTPSVCFTTRLIITLIASPPLAHAVVAGFKTWRNIRSVGFSPIANSSSRCANIHLPSGKPSITIGTTECCPRES